MNEQITEITPLSLMLPNCKHSLEFDKIAGALVEALPKIAVATKDAVNPHLKNRYADLASVMDVAKGPLAESGVAILQPPTVNETRQVMVATILLHKSGQWVSNELQLQAVDDRAQSIGSTITYARRYSLSGLLGIVADIDDDGNDASGVSRQQRGDTRRTPTPVQETVGQRRIAEEKAKLEAQRAEQPEKKEPFRATDDDLPPALGGTGHQPPPSVDEARRKKMREDYASEARPWSTVSEMRECFKQALETVGAEEYTRCLSAHGASNLDDFIRASRSADAQKCYRELCGIAQAIEQGAAA